jgi:sporulation protein YlmC with PRC-barrel domain
MALMLMLSSPAVAQECTQTLDQIEAQMGQAEISKQDRTDVKKMTEAARTLAETGNKDECMKVVADIERFFNISVGGAVPAGAAQQTASQDQGQQQAPGNQQPAQQQGSERQATGGQMAAGERQTGGEKAAGGEQAGSQSSAQEQAAGQAGQQGAKQQGGQQQAQGKQQTGQQQADQQQENQSGQQSGQHAGPAGAAEQAAESQQGTGGGQQTEGPATTEVEQPSQIEPEREQMAATPENPLAQLRADEVIGQSIVNANGETVGEISGLVIDDQEVVYAIVGVGGFLGIGQKAVAIPFNQLQMGGENVILMSEASEEQLQEQPAYKEGTYQEISGDQPIGGGGTDGAQ